MVRGSERMQKVVLEVLGRFNVLHSVKVLHNVEKAVYVESLWAL